MLPAPSTARARKQYWNPPISPARVTESPTTAPQPISPCQAVNVPPPTDLRSHCTWAWSTSDPPMSLALQVTSTERALTKNPVGPVSRRSGAVVSANDAVTEVSSVRFTTQVSVPEQPPPDQPVKSA